jgi:hypothetical protein
MSALVLRPQVGLLYHPRMINKRMKHPGINDLLRNYRKGFAELPILQNECYVPCTHYVS